MHYDVKLYKTEIATDYATLTNRSCIVMEIARKLDEPYITLRNWVFLKDVSYTLNKTPKKKSKNLDSKTELV